MFWSAQNEPEPWGVFVACRVRMLSEFFQGIWIHPVLDTGKREDRCIFPELLGLTHPPGVFEMAWDMATSLPNFLQIIPSLWKSVAQVESVCPRTFFLHSHWPHTAIISIATECLFCTPWDPLAWGYCCSGWLERTESWGEICLTFYRAVSSTLVH